MQDHLLQIGSICRAHGLRGELRIKLFDPASDAMSQIKRIWTGTAAPGMPGMPTTGEGLREWRICGVRGLDAGLYLVSLAGVSDRTAAEALHAQAVYASRDELPQLAEHEAYMVDLIGCEVVLLDKSPIGIVSDIAGTAGNPLLIVKRPGRADALIPAVPEMVVSIQLDVRRVVVNPPEGLLELDQ